MLAFNADKSAVAALEQAAGKLGIPFKVIRDTCVGGREAYEARLVLDGPDQYVVWAGNSGPDDAEDLMRMVIGRA